MMVTVVNFHHYGSIEKISQVFPNWMYVGRVNKTYGLPQSPLANPFASDHHANATFSENPIADYKRWLWRKMLYRDRSVIEALERIGPDTALVCWCSPKPCHADVIVAAAKWWQESQQLNELPDTMPSVALSIRQPWPWLITRPDIVDPIERALAYRQGTIKDIENRDWSPSHRGWFLIHAAKTFDEIGYRYAVSRYGDIDMPLPSEYERGGIVGMAYLLDVVERSQSRWFAGRYGLVLRDAHPLPFVEITGHLNFFKVNEAILQPG